MKLDDVMVMILHDAAAQYRGWLNARFTTEAERTLATLKLTRCEQLIDQTTGTEERSCLS